MEQQTNPVTPKPLIKPVASFPRAFDRKNLVFVSLALVIVLAGVGTGWLLSGGVKKTSIPLVESNVSKEVTSAGSGECKFDTTQGDLKSGGVDGEGTHRLEKEGGPSQNVYLTSTVLDLESFVGKKVEVCGETIAGKRAGWLMDVITIKQI